MSEKPKGKLTLSRAERQAVEQRLRDLQKVRMIDYDNSLVKVENSQLKMELQERRRMKMLEKLAKSKAKSKSKQNSLFKSELPPAMARNASMQSGLFSSQATMHSSGLFAAESTLNRSGVLAPGSNAHTSSILYEQPATESLPVIKRKGTSYHKRFLNEVRPRDYKVYLSSLRAVNDYRQEETLNSHLKKRLQRVKMQNLMVDFKKYSKDSWKQVDQIQHHQHNHEGFEKQDNKAKAGETKKELKKEADNKEQGKAPVAMKETTKPRETAKPVEQPAKPMEQPVKQQVKQPIKPSDDF